MMMRVEPVSGSENNSEALVEAQYVRRVEMLTQARERIKKVEENKQANISEKFQEEKDDKLSRYFSREEQSEKPEKAEPKSDEYGKKKLNFLVNEETGQVIIQMVNRQTGEVIREIPPEEMVTRMAKIVKGNNLIDKKV